MKQNLKAFIMAMAVVVSSISMAHAVDLGGGVADAGPDQELCTPISSTMMAANAPMVPGTGTWTVISGSFVIVDPHDPTTTLTGLSVGENIAEWTIDNGIDPAASDQVSIFVYDSSAPVSSAGPDQSLCSPSASTMLWGSTVIAPATGTWSLVSGSATIVDPTSPNTDITDLGVGENVLMWTVDNGPCGFGPPTSDTVSIFVYDDSAPSSDAGPDQSLCSPSASTMLWGSTVIAPATGTWSLVSGSATIVDPTSPSTSITDLAVGENVLMWTVDNGPCGPPTTDQVSIRVYDESAPAADAGPDQELFAPVTSAALFGNEPVYPASGTWTVVSGTGTFDDAFASQATVSDLSTGENVFRWTIENGPCSNGITTDEVIVTVQGQSGVEICNNGIDDDGDGLIDLNDPDCPCSTVLVQPDVEGYIENRSFEEKTCCPNGFVTSVSPPWLDCAIGWHQATSATADYFHTCGYSPVGFNLPSPAGDGAVGIFAFPEYFEYIGTELTLLGSQVLLADSTYTVSLWISTAVVNNAQSQSLAQGSYSDPFTDALPLAIFGSSEQSIQFPLETEDCIGLMPGWNELGRTSVQLGWEWTRVSITFTPQEDIHTIMIGGACDVPSSLGEKFILDPVTGEVAGLMPYYVIDDLLLTRSQDQVLQSVEVNGSFCAGDIELTSVAPAGSSDPQWYFNGAALPGETAPVLSSATVVQHGGGTYAITSELNGERLLGSTYISDFCAPPNDFCQAAQQVGYLAVDSVFVGTVVGDFTDATETRPTPTCVDSSTYTWQDLWYYLVAQPGDLVTLSLNTDSAMLAGIEVFKGNCGDSSMVCSADGAPIMLSLDSAGIYRIRIFSLDARSPAGAFELHITQEHTTAIHEETAGNVRVYPNPSNGNFSLVPQFNAPNARIAVLDMAGRIVHSEKASLNTGSVHALSLQGKVKPGSYLLEITSPEGRSVTRLLVN